MKRLGRLLIAASMATTGLWAAEQGAKSGAAEFPVAAFGARGDGQTDDGSAIQRAIDAAIAAGRGARVVFDAGKTYRLAAQSERLAVLSIGRASGISLAGNGAMLVAHPSNRLLTIFDSRDVTVGDLFFDYDPLPFTQARLTEILPAEQAIRFRIEPGYADPAEGDEKLYRDFKNSDAVFLKGATRKFTHGWARLRSVRAVGARTFEARFHQPDFARRLEGATEGDFIAIKLPFPEARPMREGEGRFLSSSSPNVYIAYSHGVRMERIVSYAAPSMTFVATASEGVVLDGCKVIRKPGSDRLIAGNSDGAHFKSLTVLPEVRDSVFEALMDDSINIKISSEVIEEVQGTRIRLRHGDIVTDGIVIEPGQTLQFISGGNKRYLGLARVAAAERLGYRQMWVTLEGACEGLAAGDLAYLKPVTDAVVERCEFRSQLKTALLVYPPARVSRCVFDDVAYGVHAPLPGTIEGPPPTGLRLADCEFLRPSVAAIALHLPTAASGPADRVACVAERCRITMGGNRGHVISAFNQRGIHLRDVAITVEDERTRANLIRLRECSDVREENVRFVARRPAPPLPSPGDPLNLSALKSPVLFAGNESTAFRDPAAFYHQGACYLFFTYNTVDADGIVWWQTAWSKSIDLAHWTTPVAFTPKDRTKNFSSPGNIVRAGGDFVLCLQTYPTPLLKKRSQPGGPVPVQYGDATARIWTMRSRDLEHWGAPELLRVLGPEVPEEKMGRLIDPFLLRDKDEPDRWWCFYKKDGKVQYSWSRDLQTWAPAGVAAAGENPCVIVDGEDYVLFSAPATGIGVSRSKDMRTWRTGGTLRLGLEEGGSDAAARVWDWARGRLSAGFVLDLRSEPRVGKAVMFFHGSRWPEKDPRGGWATHVSLGLAWSDDLVTWSWPGKNSQANVP